jgi:hypothetical protein
MRSSDTTKNTAGTNRQAWERLFREAVHLGADTDIADDCGLARVLARIEREKPRSHGWFARLGGYLRPMLALACSVIVIQGAVIVYLWPTAGPEYAIVRVLPLGKAGRHEPFIRVAFLPDTTEQALRVLLNSLQADVVAGPTQLGDYYLLVPPGQANTVARTLAQHGIVESTALVDKLPGEK